MDPTKIESSSITLKPKIKIKVPKKTRRSNTKKKYRKYDKMTRDSLKENFDSYIKDLDPEIDELEYNNFLRNRERIEREDLMENKDGIVQDTEKIIDSDVLYPSLDDTEFNKKITLKKEFLDTKQDLEIKPVEKQSDILCNSEFELAPHQMFVRNFLSFQTPYNGLLLFHGLGTGKTCSAISVCEEMRDYMKQTGITRKIVIVASPNVQQNFRLQLFDERKLKEINGIWNIRACTGNKFLKEINPMNMNGLPKTDVIKQINRIIKQNYKFLGYTEFSNYISKIIDKYSTKGKKNEKNNTIWKSGLHEQW